MIKISQTYKERISINIPTKRSGIIQNNKLRQSWSAFENDPMSVFLPTTLNIPIFVLNHTEWLIRDKTLLYNNSHCKWHNNTVGFYTQNTGQNNLLCLYAVQTHAYILTIFFNLNNNKVCCFIRLLWNRQIFY